MFISTAYAQGGAAAPGSPIGSIVMLVIIVLIFYFLLIRPQQRRMKEHRQMVQNIRRGDKVVTGGGILGTVTKVGEGDEITVEIAEGVRVQINKHTISSVTSKTEPVKGSGKGASSKSEGSKAGAAKAGDNKEGDTKEGGGPGRSLGKLLGGGGKKQ
jgi:preprotein translocase subunit YajC